MSNEMDDYELFGGEPPEEPKTQQPQRMASPQAGAQPRPQSDRGGASAGGTSIADTAAAVARRKQEANRTALMHELMLIVGFLAIIGVGWLVWSKYMEKQEALAKQQHEYEMAERKAQAERDEARRQEDRKRREDMERKRTEERERRAKELEARRQAAEQKRLAQESARKNLERFRAMRTMFRGAEVDYYRNAADAERPDKVGAEALFVCMFPGGGDGCDFYELRTKADGGPFESQKLVENGAPQPIAKEKFEEMLKTQPWLILRDRGQGVVGTRAETKAYLFNPTRKRRGEIPVPDAEGSFSPTREEFGALCDAVKAIGCNKSAFKYRVEFRGGGLANPVLVKELALGEEIGRAAFREVVREELKKIQRRGHAVSSADVETALRTGRVVYTTVR